MCAVGERAAALNGPIRLRVNDALDAGAPLNGARAVQAGCGRVQFAVRQSHHVERDAALTFIDFFERSDCRHFGVAAPPNGGRFAVRAIEAAGDDFAVHDRQAPVLHAHRRFFSFFHCKLNEPLIPSRHYCLHFYNRMFLNDCTNQ
jgi:hypothetical protein